MERLLSEALDYLPDSVEKVSLRSDTAGYYWDFMFYLAKGAHPRFGVIDFSVSADVTPEFRTAVGAVREEDWKSLRLKALRLHFICLAGRVIEHARQTIIRLASGHPAYEVFQRVRERIRMFALAT